jgi:protease I
VNSCDAGAGRRLAFSTAHTGENVRESGKGARVTHHEHDLSGKKIAFLATDGFEDSELTEPWKAVEEAGGTAELISVKRGQVRGKNNTRLSVGRTVDEVEASEYDGLVLPGGLNNPDKLRMNERAVSFARNFFEQGKPVGVICHGGWTLVEADVLRGRTLTSYPSIRTDIENAGGTWVDEEVVVDRGLVSSRKPSDLPAFSAKIVEEFAEGVRDEQAQAYREAAREPVSAR